MFDLYNENYEETYEENKESLEHVLHLPLTYEQYSLMKKEWNKQLDTLSFSDVKTKNNNHSKNSFKKLFSKFKKNNNNKTKNVSFYRVLIN